MSLATPSRLGPYEIQSRLGAGGMGEVYRARDSKLNRDVAIKVLPEAVARDAERLARFRREAQLLASLNHPHVGAIYGLEEAGGIQFLVLELIDGETLADRLRRGALPAGEAFAITRQISDALAAAHERGVIHRDLKPGNIALTADDQVKVLDFGLAKSTDRSSADPALADSPTITAAGVTSDGVILGTAPYMSPEQAGGRVVDRRADVWAVGCVLYEMLTGRRAFGGETVTETLANVLKGEPDWRRLPHDLPPVALEILQGTLRKERKERIADVSTIAFLIDQQAQRPAPVGRARSWWTSVAWLAAGTIGGVLIAAVLWWRPATPVPSPVTRFTYDLPAASRLMLSRKALALSPDGTRAAFTTTGGLLIRALAESEGHVVPGTQAATSPVFAPDGQSIVFWHDNALKRLTIGSASTLTLCQVGSAPNHMSWTGDTILFSQGRSTIMRVPATGGTPTPAVDLSASGDFASSAQLLPDGDTVLFTMVKRASLGGTQVDADEVVVQSLATGVRHTLFGGASDARYLGSGHLVYSVQGTLFAVPFDPGSRRTSGESVAVVEGVRRSTTFVGVDAGRPSQYAISESGTLSYVPGSPALEEDDLVLLDHKGAAEPLKLPPGRYQFPRVSPDGTRIALGALGLREAMIAVHDRANPSSLRRLTFGGNNRYPVWSPDSQRIAFQSDRDGPPAVFWQAASGGSAERLTMPEPGVAHVPESWSADGQTLLFTATKDLKASLWTLSMKDRRVAPFGDVRDSYLSINPVFSPDGRWVAYQFAESPEQGEAFTYIEAFPPNGTKHQVGSGGRPAWSRDGTQLFFIPNPVSWLVVDFLTRPEVTITRPKPVPRWFGVANPASRRPFDLMPDGRVVAVATPDHGVSQVPRIQFVLNWLEELKARVPVAGGRKAGS